MECFEEDFTPLETPQDVTVWDKNRKRLIQWAEKFCNTSGVEMYEPFL
jgi:hypothetical protein